LVGASCQKARNCFPLFETPPLAVWCPTREKKGGGVESPPPPGRRGPTQPFPSSSPSIVGGLRPFCWGVIAPNRALLAPWVGDRLPRCLSPRNFVPVPPLPGRARGNLSGAGNFFFRSETRRPRGFRPPSPADINVPFRAPGVWTDPARAPFEVLLFLEAKKPGPCPPGFPPEGSPKAGTALAKIALRNWRGAG